MLFSEAFKVRRGIDDDWFDLILDTDTPLFVGPFLIFRDTGEDWTVVSATMALLVASRCRVRS